MKRFALFSLLLSSSAAHAAIVTTSDGGRLVGEIISSTANEVVLRIGSDQVRIGADKIQNIDYSQTAPGATAPSPPAYRRPSNEELFGRQGDTLSFDFGLAIPLNTVNFHQIGGGEANNGDVGPALGAQYLHEVAPRAALGVDVHWYYRSVTDSPDLLNASSSRVLGDTLLMMGALKYELTDHGSARPYLQLGAGAHRTSTTIYVRPDTGFTWSDTATSERRRIVDDAAWGAAFSARLGVDLAIAEPYVFSVEAGWTGLTSANYRATRQGAALGLSGVSGPLNFFTLAARMGWRL